MDSRTSQTEWLSINFAETLSQYFFELEEKKVVPGPKTSFDTFIIRTQLLPNSFLLRPGHGKANRTQPRFLVESGGVY
jgi:hypothetical protein